MQERPVRDFENSREGDCCLFVCWVDVAVGEDYLFIGIMTGSVQGTSRRHGLN